jgi:hypothetical protein
LVFGSDPVTSTLNLERIILLGEHDGDSPARLGQVTQQKVLFNTSNDRPNDEGDKGGEAHRQSSSDAPTEGAAPTKAIMTAADNAMVDGSAGNSLSFEGEVLPKQVIDPDFADLKAAIVVGDDVPLSTHVALHRPTSELLQRTTSGTWVPWDGRGDSLIDNGFQASAGKLTFDIANGGLSGEFFPLTYTLAYRTKAGLKFGVFEVVPRQPLHD